MTQPPRILVVDDDRILRRALVTQLGDEGYEVASAASLAEAEHVLADQQFTLVLLDIRLSDGDGLELLERLRKEQPALRVIMASAFGDSERVIHAMSLGAFDYVTKPFDLEHLLAAVSRAVATPKAVDSPTSTSDVQLIGSSPPMLEVWKAIGRAASSNVPVLITGETGVGKELVARAVHAHGPRRDRPFVALNLGAITPTLVESELFGHEKGAFTGAAGAREGRFAQAADGTLFLDEIADLDASLQTKLLRVLEDGGFERVGGGTRLVSRARIITATSRPIEPGKAGVTMREDLFYRLGVLRIDVPPLRDRRQDIPALVHRFLRDVPAPRRAVSSEGMRRLESYAWPGNVRELRHVIQQAAVMSRAEILDAADFQLRTLESIDGELPSSADDDLLLGIAIERLERAYIERALTRTRGNRTEAARLLGIRRALLYDRMRHFGLDKPKNAPDAD